MVARFANTCIEQITETVAIEHSFSEGRCPTVQVCVTDLAGRETYLWLDEEDIVAVTAHLMGIIKSKQSATKLMVERVDAMMRKAHG